MGLVIPKEWERREKDRRIYLQNLKLRTNTGSRQWVRWKIFIDGKRVRTVSMPFFNYTEFMRPFEQRFPEYAHLLNPESIFDHTSREARLVSNYVEPVEPPGFSRWVAENAVLSDDKSFYKYKNGMYWRRELLKKYKEEIGAM
jgi:hypothetical protein